MRLLVSSSCTLALCCLPLWLSGSDAAPARTAQRTKTGFVEYYLGRINREGTDYGQLIERLRGRWLESTVRDPGFWASLAMLLVSVLGFVLVFDQHQEKNRREIIAADLLAQYHNAWIEAGRRAEEAIARYNQLARAKESDKLSSASGAGTAASGSSESGTTAMDRESNIVPPLARQRQKDAAPELRSRERLAVAKPDLLAQVSALQEQLSAASEREKSLERELARPSRERPSPRTAAAKNRDGAEGRER